MNSTLTDMLGDGWGTHISILMEIQPGEYDDLLIPWPFSLKVTFTLLGHSTEVFFIYERKEAV